MQGTGKIIKGEYLDKLIMNINLRRKVIERSKNVCIYIEITDLKTIQSMKKCCHSPAKN